jgi:L-seryl-tRNA(Ser) seleniumtransferase/D-glucosaminate-6-phosphate ammonia-lyase
MDRATHGLRRWRSIRRGDAAVSIFDSIGAPTVINAAGKMTALGGSAQAPQVADALRDAAGRHVDLQALRAAVGARIAELTGAAAASVTTGAAAGTTIAVAACITGCDLERVRRMPNSEGLANVVLLQAGHDIDFGAPVEQMIRLGGGRPRCIGSRAGVSPAALEAALATPQAPAACLFVQSHHCLQTGRLRLETVIARCQPIGVPVIVDAAAEEDLRRYIGAGADLVTYSGGKAFGGPTSGFITGRQDLIAACELQQRGIARTMKVGKEQLAGLWVALQRYVEADAGAASARRREILMCIHDGLAAATQLEVAIDRDEAGRDIERVALRWPAGDLRGLLRQLAEGAPSIRTRNHHLQDGYVLIDPRELDMDQARTIVARILAIVQSVD